MHLSFGSNRLTLLPSLTVTDEARGLLFVADLHLGKTMVFQQAGLGLPEGSDAETLQRLDAVVRAHPVTTLVILGDVFHARSAGLEVVLARLAQWQREHADLHWLIVPGNHDRRVPWADWLPWATILSEGERVGPWAVAHHLPAAGRELTLCGHLHPGIALGGARIRKVTVPCFWQTGNALVLPAFGAFTGLQRVQRLPDDRVWVALQDRVIALPESQRPPRSGS